MTDIVISSSANNDLGAIVAAYNARYFNDHVVAASESLYQRSGHKGYNSHSDFTNDFDFGRYKVKSHNPPYTMCVSFQFEIILMAINAYCEEKNDQSPHDFLTRAEWFGLRGLTLQNCVWENEHCHSVGKACSLFGIGEILDFSQLQPGSFISYDHGSGGHSVCFLGFLNSQARVLSKFDSTVAGFRFIASNGSGSSGEGISYRDGVLLGKHMDQGSFKQSKGIHNMRCGAMFQPSSWIKQARDYSIQVTSELFADTIPTVPSGQR